MKAPPDSRLVTFLTAGMFLASIVSIIYWAKHIQNEQNTLTNISNDQRFELQHLKEEKQQLLEIKSETDQEFYHVFVLSITVDNHPFLWWSNFETKPTEDGSIKIKTGSKEDLQGTLQ
jgi:hypothetical protein